MPCLVMKKKHSKNRSDAASDDGNPEKRPFADPPGTSPRSFLVDAVQGKCHKIYHDQKYNNMHFYSLPYLSGFHVPHL